MNDKRRGQATVIAVACLGILSLLGVGLPRAASIPAWLDDAITSYNEKNTGIQIRFTGIKDSFVWYTIPDTAEIGSKDIREGIYGIAQANGYKMTAEEELVTTAKPPSPNKPYEAKKCWKRSFVLEGAATSAGRMLTTYVCEDGANWFAGFRILQ